MQCLTCGCEVPVACVPANDNLPVPANDNEPGSAPIYVAADHQLRCVDYVQQIAVATMALGLSRRKVAMWLADMVFGFEGALLVPGGKLYPRPDTLIDDVLGNDGSFRWLSNAMSFATHRPRQATQWRVVPRWRLLDLGHRIAARR